MSLYDVQQPPNLRTLESEIRDASFSSEEIGSIAIKLVVTPATHVDELAERRSRASPDNTQIGMEFTLTTTNHGTSPTYIGYIDGDERNVASITVISQHNVADKDRSLGLYVTGEPVMQNDYC